MLIEITPSPPTVLPLSVTVTSPLPPAGFVSLSFLCDFEEKVSVES